MTSSSKPLQHLSSAHASQPPGRRAGQRHNLSGNEPTKPSSPPPSQPQSPHELHNRISAVISHIPWYAFKTQARLARDSDVSKAAVNRLLRGECLPSLHLALRLCRAIEQRLSRTLDLRELFSLDGSYPTPSVCRLMGCRNCLPQQFYDEQETIKPEFKTVAVGAWSMSKKHQRKTHSPAEEFPDTSLPEHLAREEGQ